MRPTCKALSETIQATGFLGEHRKTSPSYLRSWCEAYGRDVRCYIRCDTRLERQRLESTLESKGYTVCKGYYAEGFTAEVKVAYFKAHHWDE